MKAFANYRSQRETTPLPCPRARVPVVIRQSGEEKKRRRRVDFNSTGRLPPDAARRLPLLGGTRNGEV